MTASDQPHEIPEHPYRHRHYKYFDFVMVGFVTVLLCSNLIGPAKVCEVQIPGMSWSVPFGAGNLFFPIGYIFGDVLTEVYGYARARKVIWAGFIAMIFAAIMTQIVIAMPVQPGNEWNQKLQPALEIALGSTPRIVIASLLAYWCGDFVNSYVMARMKLWSSGKHLWMRTIGSTLFGQGVDSLLFYPLAFLGPQPAATVFLLVFTNFFFKVMVEVVFTPVTYLVVNFLKRAENEDFYDTDTNFTPFSVAD